MTDRFDEMARNLEQIFECDWREPDPRDMSSDVGPQEEAIGFIAAALRAVDAEAEKRGSKAGQKAMREKAATVAGTLAETTYDNEPEFSAVTDVEAAIRALPIEDTP